MSKSLGFSKREAAQEQKHSQKCNVNGCPLVWVGTGLCSFHLKQPTNKWTEITRRILEHRNIYDTYVRVLHMGPGAFDQQRRSFEHYSLAPEEGENGLSYQSRLLAEFRRAVTKF